MFDNLQFDRKLPWVIFLLASFIFIYPSCSSDDEEEEEEEMEMMEKDEECVGLNVSYSDDILPLINRSCALSGCHVDGFNNGDFTSYDGLKERADSGSLDLRVVSQKSMPPASSSGPTLTDDERLLFKCWIEGGALNN